MWFFGTDKFQSSYGKLVTKGTTYAYDGEGNLIRKREPDGGVWQYEYFGNGMLSKVTKPDKTEVTFKYDSLGRRIEKCSDSKVIKFVWDGNMPLHEWQEVEQTPPYVNESLVTWLFDDGFVPVAKLTNEGNYSIISDYLGTPVEAYDEDGKSVWSAELDIYGRVKACIGEEGFVPFRYQGQYADSEIGLYYNRFRYYSPDDGRYTQQDPIGLAGGNPTLYGYVRDTNNSLDLFGLFFSDVIWKKGQSIWNSGKLSEHYMKHVIKQLEFGNISMKEYHSLMEAFLKDTSSGFKQAKVGNQLIKYDPATGRVLVGHAKDRKILSFYKALPEHTTVDPWTDAINEAMQKTGISESEVKIKCTG